MVNKMSRANRREGSSAGKGNAGKLRRQLMKYLRRKRNQHGWEFLAE